MNIAVLGLGNVGLVSALCLSDKGHDVIGVEINQEKVESLKKNIPYILEDGLEDLILKNKSKINFTTNINDCGSSDIYIICVGTPTSIDGSVYVGQVVETLKELVRFLKNKDKKTIILRSTVPPGTVENEVLPIIKKSGIDFEFIYHPEFLREGSAVKDFLEPNIHVIGLEADNISCDELFEDAPTVKKVNYATAEMIKYLNNSFHALKVSFINEVASVASAYDVNVSELVDCFLADKKLNVSEKYLKPGFAFGGPCLVKDIRGLNTMAQSKNIKVPLVDSILKSNEAHLMRVIKVVNSINPKNILLFGLAFKEGTSDLRSSPVLDLVNLLSKTPSYIPKKRIFLRDSKLVREEVKDNGVCTFVEDVSQINETIDLILVGAYKMNTEELEFCNCFKGPILDLGYRVNQIDNDEVRIAYE